MTFFFVFDFACIFVTWRKIVMHKSNAWKSFLPRKHYDVSIKQIFYQINQIIYVDILQYLTLLKFCLSVCFLGTNDIDVMFLLMYDSRIL